MCFSVQTAKAFLLLTRSNIQAAELLLTQHNFDYVQPGVFADDASFLAKPDNAVGEISTLIL